MSAPVVARYQLGPAAVEVETRDPAALEWLDEALRPWFAATGDGGAVHRVRLVQSASEVAALEALAADQAARERLCFALDSRLVTLPTWPRGAELVVRDAERECFYRLAGGQVDVVARPGSLPPRVGLMRVVREIACARVRSETATLELHAAAFTIDGWAALILGPKGAGKTSLLLHVLGSGLARLVANDRVFVRKDAAGYTILGVPTLVRVRSDTLDAFPALRAGLPAGRRAWLASLRELGTTGSELPPVGDDRLPLGLTPAQFCRQIGVPPAAAGHLSALVFPEIQSGADGWELEPLAPDLVAERIRANRHGGLLQPRAPSIFEELVGGLAEGPGGGEELPVRIGTAVSAYRCVLGKAAYDDPGGALKLLQRLDAPIRAAEIGPRR